jgi:RimJ/RimL family protein N-acetyltransferase
MAFLKKYPILRIWFKSRRFLLESFEIEVIEWPAHVFGNGEIFLSTADISYKDKKVYWRIPKSLSKEFKDSFTIDMEKPFSESTVKRYSKWFDDVIGLPQGSFTIDCSISYDSYTDSNLWTNNVVVNSDNLGETYVGEFSDSFYNKSQLSCAYIVGGEIISIANDNGNGSITIATMNDHQGNGYATECLNRLIHEYHSMGKTLGFGTTQGNKQAIRVAEKCGMKLSSKGYWVRLNPKKRKQYHDIIDKYI